MGKEGEGNGEEEPEKRRRDTKGKYTHKPIDQVNIFVSFKFLRTTVFENAPLSGTIHSPLRHTLGENKSKLPYPDFNCSLFTPFSVPGRIMPR